MLQGYWGDDFWGTDISSVDLDDSLYAYSEELQRINDSMHEDDSSSWFGSEEGGVLEQKTVQRNLIVIASTQLEQAQLVEPIEEEHPNSVVVLKKQPVCILEEPLAIYQQFRTVAHKLCHPVLIGAVTGISARIILTQLALCVGVGTGLPALGVALGIGAISGAVSKWAAESRKDTKTEGWQKRAIMNGALWGGLGGTVGFGVADFFTLNSLGFSQNQAPVVPAVVVKFVPSTALHLGIVPESSVVSKVPDISSYKSVIKHMSPSVRHLYKIAEKTHNPETTLRFLKEASFYLLNHTKNLVSHHMGLEMIRNGADLAQHLGVSTKGVGAQLIADLKYCQTTGACDVARKIVYPSLHR